MTNASYQPFWAPSLEGIVEDIKIGTCNYPDHFNNADIYRIEDIVREDDGLIGTRYQCPACGRVYLCDALNPP